MEDLQAARKMLSDAGIADLSEENIFIAAACKEKGIQFLKGEGKTDIPYKPEPVKKGSPAPIRA